MQNGFVESFNGRVRDELLNEHLLDTLRHARHLVATWRRDYNEKRTAQRDWEQGPGSTGEIHRRIQPVCVIRVRKI